jgi:V/A-type H+-transporting ATPase subunit B
MGSFTPERVIEGATEIKGPLMILENVPDIGYDEVAEIELENGEIRHAKVLKSGEKAVTLQVFEGTFGINKEKVKVRFKATPLKIGVSKRMLGRIFNGAGRPIDGFSETDYEDIRDVNGLPINPYMREYPRDFAETGISSIDLMNSLVRGQKLPIFSAAGLPHNELAAQIASQVKIKGATKENFAVVFAAMGVKYDDAHFFKTVFEETGAINNTILFLNLANDPPIERLITPRVALTAAEFLAFERNMHIFVIITDMTNYAEALREVATALGEIPARKGFPGYMYSDLATIYERAGRVKGSEGSITQIPILSMPNDDITHPIPDLTGYITEGQIVLSRELHNKGIYPPVDVPVSLSRLMKEGIGEGKTREDHARVSNQLYALYARVKEVRNIASIVGEEELGAKEKLILKFGNMFEQKLVGQKFTERRTIEESLEIGWELLSMFPVEDLTGIPKDTIEKYYKKDIREKIEKEFEEA